MKYIAGYATIFNQWYQVYDRSKNEWYYERIIPEACTPEFLDSQIVIARLCHDERYKLSSNFRGVEWITRTINGKTEKYNTGYIGDGKLKLKADKRGLFYSFEVDENNRLHKAVVRMIKERKLRGSSLSRYNRNTFIPDWKNSEPDGKFEVIKGVRYRTVNDMNLLFDVSPCKTGQNPFCTLELLSYDPIEDRQVRTYDEQILSFKTYEKRQYLTRLKREYLPNLK